MPLPRGLVKDVDLRVDGSDGALQTDVLDRWSDGSARWALVSLRVNQDDATPSGVALAVAEATKASQRPSLIRRDGLRVLVDTGRLQLTLGTGGRWPVLAASIDGREVCDIASSGLLLTAAGGAEIPVSVDRVWVERAGPSHALIRASGQHMDAGRALAYVEWQITVYAGLPVMQVAITLRNPRKAEHPGGHWELGDSGSLLLEDVTFALRLPARDRVSAAACSADAGEDLAGVALPFALYQESSGGERWQGTNHVNRDGRVPQTIRGYRRSDGITGLRATPLLHLQTSAGAITLATRQFWQNCPKQLAIDAEGVSYSLWPREYPDGHELQGGEQRTHVFALAFGDDGITDVALDWWRSPLVPVIDPAWTAATGAIAQLLPEARDPHAAYIALVRQAIEGADTFAHKRERVDEYGWRHFGDIYGDHEAVRHQGPEPLVSHYNNQYDPVFGFAVQFLRSGDPRWWPHCDALASHVVDVDIYHTTEDKAAYNNGLFWHTVHYIDAGKATHRTYPKAAGSHGGGPASEQNYTTGLMTHWFLTGNPLSRETAIALGQFVIDIDDGTKTPFKWLDGGHTGLATASASEFYHGPGRGSGNSLNALIDAHRLSGDARFLEKADQVIRRAVHPRQDIAALNLPDIERKWFYTMFLQSLGKYLDYRAELGRLDAAYAYARETLLHFARWMAEHEYPYLEKPEVLEFPTETWPAQDIRKSEVFMYAALHASGAERERFFERADFFFRYSVDTLTADRRKSLARPVILLLAHGWRHAWALANRDASAPVPSVTPATWPPHEVFVPQKARAMKRAKMITGAVATATLAGAVALLTSIVW
ncbi:hypothetical protein [Luteitalea pratensis]|uniref:hypothetical protein n=1 Tax=Luteitalea pratensis TaxID=1855912 RepID=UPI001F1668F1